MMKIKTFSSALLLVTLTGLMMFVAACGSQATPSNSNNNPTSTPAQSSTPSPSPPAQHSPTPTVTAGQVASGSIQVQVSKGHFSSTETVTITIVNGLSTPVYTAANATNCTPVLLERQINGAWAPLATCRTAVPQAIPINGGASYVVSLSPAPTNLASRAPGGWSPGTYRAIFTYQASPDPDTVGGTHVASNSFVIA